MARERERLREKGQLKKVTGGQTPETEQTND